MPGMEEKNVRGKKRKDARNHVQVEIHPHNSFRFNWVKSPRKFPCPLTISFYKLEHCQLAEWAAWEWEGDKGCGLGTRRRFVKVAALHGGNPCEKNELIETKTKECMGRPTAFTY